MDIAFGVIGTVGVALHSARRVYELLSGIKGAPDAVNNVSKDVIALSNALEMLQNVVRTFKEPEQMKMLPMLQSPLDNCVGTLHDIEIKVKPYVKMQSGKKSIWRGFTWTFREKDIIILQNTLLAHKQSLDIAISIADYSNNLSSSSENRENFQAVRRSIRKLNRKLDADRESVGDDTYDGSEAGSTDYAYTMKQWLLRAETVFGEVASDDPLELESLELESDTEEDADKANTGTDSGFEHDTDSNRMRSHTQTVDNPSIGDQAGNFESGQTSNKAESQSLKPTAISMKHLRSASSEKLGPKVSHEASATRTPDEPGSMRSDTGGADDKSQRRDFDDAEQNDKLIKPGDTEPTAEEQGQAEKKDQGSSTEQPLSDKDVNPVLPGFRRPFLGPLPNSEPLGSIFSPQPSELDAKLAQQRVTARGKEPALPQIAETPEVLPGQFTKLERCVTDLLKSVKSLLEALTKWARKEASEQEISDIYVQLGFNFNLACRAFMEMGIKTSDLPNVPERLRVLLEQTLIQEASQESLNRYLADIRQLIIDLLTGLKRKQKRAREIKDNVKTNESVLAATVDRAQPYIALIGDPPGTEMTENKAEKASSTDEASASSSTVTSTLSSKLPIKPREEIKAGDIVIAVHTFEMRSPDEIGFLKGDQLKILETDEEFKDGWYLGQPLNGGTPGLFPAVYTAKLPGLSVIRRPTDI